MSATKPANETKSYRETTASKRSIASLLWLAVIFLCPVLGFGQTTSFTYQGRLSDGGAAANGTYDMQFKLFDTASAGNQIGSTMTNGAVLVSNGVFTVQLDYGAAAFSGADRYLEIGMRLAGDANPYTILAPRQQLTSAVYAIRAGTATTADTAKTADTANSAVTAKSADTAKTADSATIATDATQLGGVAANQYVQTSDARLTDARTPTAGSSNYIQNTSSQETANFNINGNGTAGGTLSANLVNTATHFSIGGNRVFHLGGGPANTSTFVGFEAGAANPSGDSNSFFGRSAGQNTTTGAQNSFFGYTSGNKNTSGSANSFFGYFAGWSNTTGGFNSFFGTSAGQSNTTGRENTFVGRWAGLLNTSANNNSFFGSLAGNQTSTGSDNSFFGFNAGSSNATGLRNSFFGAETGSVNTTGSTNSFFGYESGSANAIGSNNSFFGFQAGSTNITGTSLTAIGANADVVSGIFNATAIGAFAKVTQANSLVLGSIGASAQDQTNVGIGTTAPKAQLHISTHGGNIVIGNAGCSSSFAGLGFGSSLSGCTNYSLLGNGTDTIINRPTGGIIAFRENNISQMSIAPGGVVSINNLSGGGMTPLCHNGNNQISTCGSSLRYKTNIQPFISGLSVLNRLRPITFDWKQGGMHDLGFGAEEIAAVEPLLVTHNDKGEVEGVKYDRITAVLVNAVKEQQEQIKQQQSQIQSLKKLVCQRNRRAAVCK